MGVHGQGWRPQVEDLAGSYTCLTFDNRGMGASMPAGEGPLTLERMVADALALADAAGWDRFHVVGHSMGGHIALGLALTARPEGISGARRVEIRHASHGVPITHAGEVNRLLREHLAGAERGLIGRP